MEAWEALVAKAFDGDSDANDVVLFIEGCGQTTTDGYTVTLNEASSDRAITLTQLGFTKVDHEQKQQYVLPSATWAALVDGKRLARTQWHKRKQQQLIQTLHDALAATDGLQSSEPLDNTERVARVKAFMQQHATNVGSIPFLRGLVGFLTFQLYKPRLAQWHMDTSVLTQNGPETIVQYVLLLKTVLGFRVEASPMDAAVISMTDEPQQDTPDLVWRMNASLTDESLLQLLRQLPSAQTSHPFTLTACARSSSAMLPSSPLLRWILLVFRRCFGPWKAMLDLK
ncbi:hypothetical protein DM01DRAFT_1308645 [Hesseltinella vesiculosa]|uniref:Uncharacterized protein n=1 Tax=Hesseltinella vesiculosa TaxID=101127 RepID=A0A1X2GBB0_9FUNG|nr:hypothetical protein DM01DRAFT_1308645 [Hesseltinella vesiculosa]